MRNWVRIFILSALPLPAVAIPIAQMDLSGEGLLPLGFDAGNPNGEYGFVQSGVSLSTLPGSEVLTAFNITPSFQEVEVTLTFELFAEITITDIDPVFDFTGSLGTGFSLFPAAPLSATLTSIVDFSSFDPADPFGTIPVSSSITSTSIKEDLNEDVNLNGELDFIEFRIEDFLFLDENDIVFDFVDPNDPEAGLIVSSASLSLSGQVADVSTDPPFTVALSTDNPPVNVDEPAFIALFSLGFIGLLVARARRSA